MDIKKNLSGKNLCLALEGRLDTNTSVQLEEEIKNLPSDLQKLTLDFAKLEYISSAGLRVILTAQKKMTSQGNMVLTNVNESIMDIFEITNFVDILSFE
ncbi:MAG: STAS domain-containing protein [Clostridia bacterium]|nr:STAS domain-containing protein [Clostridia bacterium]